MYGLPKSDATHLTPEGLITHGEQIFATYTLLLSGQTPYSSCTISSSGNTVSTLEKVSWGQSFKSSCSGFLSEISFNSATNVSSSLTLSISNGADCNATQLHTQSISSITDGNNSIPISSQIYIDKEHTYYMNITSDLDEVWKVRFNQTSQVIGSLRTSQDGQASSTCGWNFPGFDINFSIVINEISTAGFDNEQSLLNNINIYPNPSQGIVNIYLHNLENISVKVVDIKGVTVYKKNNINALIYEIDLRNNPAGIYFVHVNYEGHYQHYKLILE